MRGLNVFISDIRNCRAKEQEEKRINKEMANIRSKFKEGNLNGYQKKKYVCKLLYMYILGYEIDFGHMEAVNLISSPKYDEKYIGYLAVTLLITENSDLARLVINSMKKDLEEYNDSFNCLALHAIANIGGREMAETLANDVYRLLISGASKSVVKKKAALALLRLFRKHPDIIPIHDWADRIIAIMDDPDMGVATSALSLVTALAQAMPDKFAGCIAKAVNRLHKIVMEKDYSPEYVYYKVPVPWLQVKLFRLLQYYPPIEDANLLNRINNVIQTVINNSQETPKNAQHSNALNAVLFEAINLAIHLNPNSDLCNRACNLLGKFIISKETNIRYLGLEALAHLAACSESLESIKEYQDQIILLLKDKDISVRRAALDLLYSMCDTSNAKRIVQELLDYMSVADWAMKEEMVLKIAILAEKFAEEHRWYVDTILNLISTAGDYVSDDVWYRVIHIVLNTESLQEYATKTVLGSLKQPNCHESTLKVAGYVLGEFGHLIANQPSCAPIDQFWALHSKFHMCGPRTRALLLSTYLKFVNLFPEIKGEIIKVLQQYQNVLDTELQQRACEYLALIQMGSEDLLATVCEEMPPFPARENALLAILKKKTEDTEDKRTWNIAEKAKSPVSKGSTNALNSSSGAQQITSSVGNPVAVATSASAPTAAKPNAALDLLGLDIGTSSAPAPVMASPPLQQMTSPSAGSPMSAGTPSNLYNALLIGANGVLHESPLLQIGVKSEYHNQLGRLGLFFGNKSQTANLVNFTTEIVGSDAVKITLTQPMGNTLSPLTQLNQMYNLECLGPIRSPPQLKISYTVTDMSGISPPTQQTLMINLPIVTTKFMTKVDFNAVDFFNKWKQIGGPPREAQSVFRFPSTFATIPSLAKVMELVKMVISGCQLSVLENVDPNKENIVGASIFHSVTLGKIGCLVRLEPNFEQKMFRLTVRTTNEVVTESLRNAVESFLGLQY